MDREIIYTGAIPQDTDLLLTNKNTMIALGNLIQATLGSNVSFDGLACTPNSPAALNVKVGPGTIHSLQNIDNTAYGSIAADTTNQIMKQGTNPSTLTLSCPAPVTTGQSIVYLVQAAFQETDTGSTVLPYYNASNPAVAYSGPNNTGVSQNTVRKSVCTVNVKPGIAATTGTQATPAPDAGYTGLYAVTVANGATMITSGNIQQLASAPFIGTKLLDVLTAIQSGAATFAQDTSGAANTITIALNPIPTSLKNGQRVAVKVANSLTGATVMNTNGLGNVAVVTTSGAAMTTNAMVANGIYTLVYDANGNRWQLQGFAAATATGLLPTNNLSDVSNPATALANIGGTIPPGTGWEYHGVTEPGGWLFQSGLTIGSASSGATARANADAQNLFTVLWANPSLAIYTSAGASSSRGANAAADWSANKRLSLPDRRGRVGVGRDDMGGTAANRVTTGGSGIAGATLGASGGEETHTLTAAESAVLTISLQSANPAGTSSFNTLDAGVGIPGSTTNNNGYQSTSTAGALVQTNAGGGAHNNMQPAIICNYIIKL